MSIAPLFSAGYLNFLKNFSRFEVQAADGFGHHALCPIASVSATQHKRPSSARRHQASAAFSDPSVGNPVNSAHLQNLELPNMGRFKVECAGRQP